ncbi:hypothetical protein DKT68_28270 [Micromonospora acroterricola]|uniref:Holin n=1 Tax=Micromonospora acroterricola TaxID=2202421 RepID=A0A317CS36_9ACTN|nr:hypothetical protein [Micromonospora acroterricola]PWR05177.1 hypothetical protein DKT68_28270 [Micromonospora acroterricola]
MTITPTTPLPAKADARNRAIRTFVQGLITDVLIAVLPVLYEAVSDWDGAFTSEYWTVVGISVLKTLAIAVVSYVMRLQRTPPGNPAA